MALTKKGPAKAEPRWEDGDGATPGKGGTKRQLTFSGASTTTMAKAIESQTRKSIRWPH
jgi:hypothetical protein